MAKPDVLEVLDATIARRDIVLADTIEIRGRIAELIAAVDALKFDVYALSGPELVQHFGGNRIVAVDMSTWDRFEAAIKACRGLS